MDRDSYKVDILHFKNPYLIWIEKVKTDGNTDEDYCFEQVGLYGVLPAELEADFVENVFKAKKTLEWSVASSMKMEEIISTADEIYFSPVFIDYHRSSIFDNKCHKFGDIFLIRNKKMECLSKILKNGSILCSDYLMFHTHLENGLVNTQLTQSEQELVIEALFEAVKTTYKQRQVRKNTKKSHALSQVRSRLHELVTKEVISDTAASAIVANKARDLRYSVDDDVKYVGSGVDSKSKSSASLPKSKVDKKLDSNPGVVCDGADRVEKVSKWLHKVGINKDEDEVDEELAIPFKSVMKHFKSATVEQPITAPSVQENEKRSVSRKASAKKSSRIPLYDSEKEQLVTILPAGACISTAKFEVRPKYIIPVASGSKEPFQQATGDIPDNLWRSIDSEVSVPINKVIIDKYKDDLYPKLQQPTTAEPKPYLRRFDTSSGTTTPAQSSMANFEVSITPEQVKACQSPMSSINMLKSNGQSPVLPDFEVSKSPEHAKSSKLISGRLNMLKSIDQSAGLPDFEVSKSPELAKASNLTSGRLKVVKSNEQCAGLPDFNVSKSPEYGKASNLSSGRLNMLKSNRQSPGLPDFEVSKSPEHGKASSGRLNMLKRLLAMKEASDNSDDTATSVEPVDSSLTSSPSESDDLNTSGTSFKGFPKSRGYFVNDDMPKFIQNITTPIVMVHSKSRRRLTPFIDLSEVYFSSHIKKVLEKWKVKAPKDIQSYMWSAILHGSSVFAVAPMYAGKTVGYVAPLCSLLADKSIFEDLPKSLGGPLAIIVCSTVRSVEDVADKCRSCLGSGGTVLACHSAIDVKHMCELVLKGCDILVATPGCLKRLLTIDFYSVDLRRLCYAVFDDFDRLSTHFKEEFAFLYKTIKAVAKNRLDTAFQVKFIVASKSWNDFLSSLARQLTDSVVCIGGFEECVVYSKCFLNVKMTKESNKIAEAVTFLKDCDRKSGRTVIVCNTNDEIEKLGQEIEALGYDVFTGSDQMNVEQLYALSTTWNSLNNSVNGNVLICSDASLHYINTTNALYLINFNLPEKYSDFCKRFSTLVDNYNSIFTESQQKPRISVLIDETNSQQLPKLVNYLKRCNGKIPDSLDDLVESVLCEKDLSKARNCIPLCEDVLSFGDCTDYWHCRRRHATFKEYDEPSPWLPRNGWIKLKVLHYHSAADFSARILSQCIGDDEKVFQQNYASLALKMNSFYGNDDNKRLHGEGKPGDLCAVQLKPSYYERCKFIKILDKGEMGKPNKVLVHLIDEEKYESVMDCYLYNLPEPLKCIPSYVARVILAGIQPRDKDLAFSNASKADLIKLLKTNECFYLKGRVALTISNVVLIDRLEACQDLKASGVSVVRYDIRKYLLESHAMENKEHISRLCAKLGIELSTEETLQVASQNEIPSKVVEVAKERWAHLEEGDFSLVYLSSTVSPEKFFLRFVKFQKCLDDLTATMQQYVSKLDKTMLSDDDMKIGTIVLALFPDNNEYNRARIDDIAEQNKLKVFFVDHGDWRVVAKDQIKHITNDLINRLPFQAIECRLLGCKSMGSNWGEMSINYFCDLCFHYDSDIMKELHAKYFMKTPSESTGGLKYSVVLIDTSSDYDVIINETLIEKNLASPIKSEMSYLKELSFIRPEKPIDDDIDICHDENEPSSDGNKVEEPTVDFENGDWEVSPNLVDMYADYVNIQNEQIFAAVDTVMGSNRKPSDMPKAKILELSMEENGANTERSVSQQSNASSKISKSFEIIGHTSDKIIEYSSDDSSSLRVETKRPKIRWRQTKEAITVKIEGTGIVNYEIDIKADRLKFNGIINESTYSFDVELYSVVDVKNSTHTPKGLYVLVVMPKLLKLNWNRLTADSASKGWIVYDVDSLTVDSSDDDEDVLKDDKAFKEYTMRSFENETDLESEVSRVVDDLTKWTPREEVM